MKKFLLLFVSVLLFTACDSSDDAPIAFESAITVDGVEFKPTRVKLERNPSSDNPNIEGLTFNLERGVSGSNDYEAILFGFSYSKSSPTGPNGVYTFGIREIWEPGANGFYYTETTTNMLYHSTVEVTYLEDGLYRFEFNDVLAVVLNQVEPIVISGYFEGKVN